MLLLPHSCVNPFNGSTVADRPTNAERRWVRRQRERSSGRSVTTTVSLSTPFDNAKEAGSVKARPCLASWHARSHASVNAGAFASHLFARRHLHRGPTGTVCLTVYLSGQREPGSADTGRWSKGNVNVGGGAAAGGRRRCKGEDERCIVVSSGTTNGGKSHALAHGDAEPPQPTAEANTTALTTTQRQRNPNWSGDRLAN
mmetsp:Transcript_14097/g.44374  ORF Transcript_14097/g.44374 Transcript_14097/m.44374 type:complete len:200 (-) Transcript_14097:30-629(-)